MSEPAQNHRRIAGTFTDRVRGVPAPDGWDVPAPVDGWTARHVVGHLVEWFPGFLASGSDTRLPAGPSVADDPAAAWQVQCDAVQAVLDDPGSSAATFTNPHTGELPLDEAIDRFYTADVFMHTWDLARATGQDDTLDPEMCAALLDGMIPFEEAMRSSGQYGPRVAVPQEAPVQDRMLGFIGRDPRVAAAEMSGSGTAEDPWVLQTPPGTSEFTMHRDDTVDPAELVCQVGSTKLRYLARCLDDVPAMLRQHGDSMELGSADENKPAKDGTLEAWARSADNPVGGWYGLRKGYRGRFAMYVPPLLEHLGLVELEHHPRNNRIRARN